MDDVVGIIVADKDGGRRAMLAWGRVYDPVDSTELIAQVRRALPQLGCSADAEVSVCWELADVRDYEYFYEGLIAFASRGVPLSRERRIELREDLEAFVASLYRLGEKRPSKRRTTVESTDAPAV